MTDRQTDKLTDGRTEFRQQYRALHYMQSHGKKLENVAINDVLPLKAARRDAIANLKCFGASDTRDLISMVTFTFTMRHHGMRV